MGGGKLCKTPGCKNKASPKKNYCTSCRSRKWREKHSLNYWFLALRGNAKRRGKIFTLTFEQFSKFCETTGYDKFKGREASCLSVDRKDPEKGYTFENIRAITVSNNSKKARGTLLELDPEWEMEEDACPF